jgi:hypothetical protein
MPITRAILSQYPNHHFVETGTFEGAALRLARDLGFISCWSCDINQASVDAAHADGFSNVFCLSSPRFLAQVLPSLAGGITFWLDAHPFLEPMDITQPSVPLLAELMAIHLCASDGPHTILIDDLRVISKVGQGLLFERLCRLWPTMEWRMLADDLAPDDILAVRLCSARQAQIKQLGI